MAAVEFESVAKTYDGGHIALHGLTLSIADGELMVIVGPSGCGKSTLLRLLAGLEAATAGTISIGGRVVNELSPRERNVAMVFQDYALYPHKTVRGNLEFPLRMRKLAVAERERRVQWASELLALESKLERLPRELSGGERQRVAMGRALVREPAVFLLDEPLSNLDAKLRAEVRGEIGELQRRTGTTMLYVTHDQVEALTLGHRVAVLDGGRLQQVAPPRELYERPANAFVAGFIGNPPMSLFEATIETDDHGRARLAIGSESAALDGADLAALSGRRWTVGLRPEALTVAETGTEGAVRAIVEQIERLGHETLAAVRIGGDAGVRVFTRLPAGRDLALGDTLSLSIAPDAVHFFDEQGERLPAVNPARTPRP